MDNIVDNCSIPTGSVNKQGKSGQYVLLVFAKQPRPGEVKTRLVPPLTAEQAATFYAFSQADTVDRLQQLNCKVVLCYSGERRYFSDRFPQIELCHQGTGDLGKRLQRMFDKYWQQGAQRICVVGTDSPDLPINWVSEAFDVLEDYDVVTIPACDGGYVLLGCRTKCPQLFTDISWSSELVQEQTEERAGEAGCRYLRLFQWQDIDDIVALRDYVFRCQRDNPLLKSRSGKYAQRCLRQIT